MSVRRLGAAVSLMNPEACSHVQHICPAGHCHLSLVAAVPAPSLLRAAALSRGLWAPERDHRVLVPGSVLSAQTQRLKGLRGLEALGRESGCRKLASRPHARW